MLRNQKECAKYDLSHVNSLFTGAAPLGEETANEFLKSYPNVSIKQAYGKLSLFIDWLNHLWFFFSRSHRDIDNCLHNSFQRHPFGLIGMLNPWSRSPHPDARRHWNHLLWHPRRISCPQSKCCSGLLEQRESHQGDIPEWMDAHRWWSSRSVEPQDEVWTHIHCGPNQGIDQGQGM